MSEEGYQQAPLLGNKETTVSAPKWTGEGPYPPPARACYVCGQTAWQWDGEGYTCAGDQEAHAEYAVFLVALYRRLNGQQEE